MNTKTFLTIVIAINILLLCFAFSAKAQRKISPDSIASKTLNSFRKMINRDNYKLFGFRSAKEISNLRLGTSPINVYMIRLDSLRKFEGGDGKTLLMNINQVIYPVYSNNTLASSIKLNYDGKNWSVESFSDREISQYYQDALKNISTAATNKTYLIRIPSLNISLLAVENSTINVQLLGNQPVGELKQGMTTTLQDALLKIKPIANAYNGLPW
jgi:hypothetical protein